MRFLPTYLLSAILPFFAALAVADDDAPEDSPTPAPTTVDRGPPASPLLRLRTADGLPVAVELVSFHQDTVRVRHPSTRREMNLSFAKLDKATQKILTDYAEIVGRKIVTMNFTVSMKTNMGKTASPVAPQVGLLGLAAKESDNAPKTIGPGGHALQIRSELPKDVPVDVLVEMKLFWALPESRRPAPTSSFNSSRGKNTPPPPPILYTQPESVTLRVSNALGEYFAKPVSKMPAPGKSWAIIVYNKATGQPLWKGGDSKITDDYLKRNQPPK